MGTKTAKVQMEVETLLLAQHAIVNGMREEESTATYELFEAIQDGLEEEFGCTLYAFNNVVVNNEDDTEKLQQSADKVLRSLARKGFFVGQWEEGSYYLALKGFEKLAAVAQARLEAKHLANEFDSFGW
jgi:virulence-associated protein VapD